MCFRAARTTIKKEFEDGESCTVTLKDRFKPQDEEAKDWYDRAFGAKRNIMKVELSLTPPPADVEPGKFRFFVKIGYQMFPEMKEQEFRDEEEKYNAVNEYIELQAERDYNNQIIVDSLGVAEYRLEMDLPYGNYQPQVFWQDVRAAEANDGGGEYQMVPTPMMDFFFNNCTPEPVSREMQ